MIGCFVLLALEAKERPYVVNTIDTLANLGASVTKKIYPGMGHTIIQDEIDHAEKIVQRVVA